MACSTIEERVLADGFGTREPVVFYGGSGSNFSRHKVRLLNPFTGRPFDYPTGEHRFQAMKATNAEEHEYVASAPDASKAKDRGRSITLRDGWGDSYGDLCWYAMVETVIAKARQNRNVMLWLTGTRDRPIYEDSPTDAIWGVRTSPVTFDGKNLLGRSWMFARYAIC